MRTNIPSSAWIISSVVIFWIAIIMWIDVNEMFVVPKQSDTMVIVWMIFGWIFAIAGWGTSKRD